jgi:hypothetical protein
MNDASLSVQLSCPAAQRMHAAVPRASWPPCGCADTSDLPASPTHASAAWRTAGRTAGLGHIERRCRSVRDNVHIERTDGFPRAPGTTCRRFLDLGRVLRDGPCASCRARQPEGLDSAVQAFSLFGGGLSFPRSGPLAHFPTCTTAPPTGDPFWGSPLGRGTRPDALAIPTGPTRATRRSREEAAEEATRIE